MTDLTDEYVKALETDAKIHPLSGSGFGHEETVNYYRTLIKNMAKNVNDHVDEADFAEINPHYMAAMFINELMKLDPERWGLFANKPDPSEH